MSTPVNEPDNTAPPAQRREMNAADANALAMAGAEAAANATPGTSQAELKRIVREAMKEEADERGVANAETIARASAEAVIAGLESRGAFNQPDEPAPGAPAVAPAVAPGGTPADPAPAPPAPPAAPADVPDDSPKPRKTLAERMLRG